MSMIQTHNFGGERHGLHIGSCKPNYHTITTTAAPQSFGESQILTHNARFW